MSTPTTSESIDRVERLRVRRLVTWAAVRVREHPVLVGVFLIAGALGYVPLLGGLPAFLATTFALGVAFAFVADDLALRSRGLGAVAAAVRERYVTLLVVSLAYAGAVFVGLLLLVLPGVYVAVRLSPALAVATLDDRGVADSLRHGWAIGKGSVLRLGGVFLAMFVLQATVAATLGLISPDLTTSGVPPVALNAVSAPILAAAIAHVALESRDDEEPAGDLTATAIA